MARITFKAKVETIYNMDETVNHTRIKIPTLTKKHCDMNAFRSHSKFGGLANSDLFPNALKGISRQVSKTGYLRIGNLPDNVKVDQSGFLAQVVIDV